MAVVSMKIVNLSGPLALYEQVSELICDSGVFQPEEAVSFYRNNKKLSAMSQEDPYGPILEQLQAAVPAACRLRQDAAPLENLSLEELKSKAQAYTQRAERLSREREERRRRLESDRELAGQLSHFVGLELDMAQISALRFTSVRFGRMPTENFGKLHRRDTKEKLFAFSCTDDGAYTYCIVFSPHEYAAEMDRILSSLYFERIFVPEHDATVEGRHQQLLQEIAELELEERQDRQAAEQSWKTEELEISALYRTAEQKAGYLQLRKYAAVYGSQFLLVGWVPEQEGRPLLERLQGLESLSCIIDDASAEKVHNPPVKLKNWGLARPFEMYVSMYGLPTYGEPDPTSFVAVTYSILFGIMFGDVGQGLLVALAGLILWKWKHMGVGRILIPCGICGCLFGFVYGSVFGFENALNPLYGALFGMEGKPVQVMEPATANLIIYLTIGIGGLLAVCAMLLNIRSCWKRKAYGTLLFSPSGLAGLLFYVGLVGGLVAQMLLGLKLMTLPYILLLIVLPLLCMFLQEPLGNLVMGKKEKIRWGDYLAQSFFELFESLLSYVTNTMSFLRVGAFVLVHAGMMLVVFTLAEMTAGVGYWLIVVIGNLLISVLEALLVSIQVLRLEYYEMFSRFFDGSGRAFAPIVLNQYTTNHDRRK